MTETIVSEQKTIELPIICKLNNDELAVVKIRANIWRELTNAQISNDYYISCTSRDIIQFFKELENYSEANSFKNSRVSEMCIFYGLAMRFGMYSVRQNLAKKINNSDPSQCLEMLQKHDSDIGSEIRDALDNIVIEANMPIKYFSHRLLIKMLTKGIALLHYVDANLEDDLVKMFIDYFSQRYHVVTGQGIWLFATCVDCIHLNDVNEASLLAITKNIHFAHISMHAQTKVNAIFNKMSPPLMCEQLLFYQEKKPLRNYERSEHLKIQAKKQALAEIDHTFVQLENMAVDMFEAKDKFNNWFVGVCVGTWHDKSQQAFLKIVFNGWGSQWGESISSYATKRFAKIGTFTNGVCDINKTSRSKFGGQTYRTSLEAALVQKCTEEIHAERITQQLEERVKKFPWTSTVIPVIEPTVAQITKLAAVPMIEPAAISVIESTVARVTEPIVVPVIEPIVVSVIEPTIAQATKQVVVQVIEPTASSTTIYNAASTNESASIITPVIKPIASGGIYVAEFALDYVSNTYKLIPPITAEIPPITAEIPVTSAEISVAAPLATNDIPMISSSTAISVIPIVAPVTEPTTVPLSAVAQDVSSVVTQDIRQTTEATTTANTEQVTEDDFVIETAETATEKQQQLTKGWFNWW